MFEPPIHRCMSSQFARIRRLKPWDVPRDEAAGPINHKSHVALLDCYGGGRHGGQLTAKSRDPIRKSRISSAKHARFRSSLDSDHRSSGRSSLCSSGRVSLSNTDDIFWHR